MKSLTTILIFIIAITTKTFPQEGEFALGRVSYESRALYIKQSPQDSSKYSKHDFQLFFGKNRSIYIRKPATNSVSFTKDTDTSSLPKDVLDKIKEHAIAPIKVRTRSAIFKKYDQPLLLTYETTQEEEKLIIIDTLERIDWTLTNEKRTILGYETQKAIGKFRGRIYDVWFTSSIPINAGPWKLYGLPGLILEAKDQKNEIFFIATSINIPPSPDFIIPFNFDGRVISEHDFIKKNNELAIKSQNMIRSMNKDNKVIMLGTTVKFELDR